MRSALVLVGGEAKRAQGNEKYFFLYEGKTFIEHLSSSLKNVTDEIILVARDPTQCKRFSNLSGVICITDIKKGAGPIGGLHAGIQAAKGDFVFAVACDMPCINQEVVSYLFDNIGEYDAIVPCWNKDMYEPLHAVYRRSALISYLNKDESKSLRDMIKNLKVKYVPVEDLRKYDQLLKTFTNINHLDELNKFVSSKE
ncbi:MAG: molybdenum cofactor guanylyltransferase [Methanoregulaceae archaeon]|jgi:molybdopterin-guanine dinucleotide biosynthesis protein A